ncbi:hypothetical protein ACWGI8_42790 [Streptomyces sp. NPDC054841]
MPGAFYARQALFAALEQAKKNGFARRNKPKRRTRLVSRDGRDPLALDAAIDG